MTDGSEDDGMGARTTGPDFSAPPPPAPPADLDPDPRLPTGPFTTRATRPRARRLPMLLSVAVIAVVAAVVIVATVVATRPEPGPPTSPGSSATGPTGSATPAGSTIEFSTPQGDGQLTLLAHRWSRSGRDTGSPDPTDSYLDVQVLLSCRGGEVDVEPGSFQVFTRKGDLYEVVEQRVVEPALSSTTVFAGETTRGWLSFDVPRGDVTLILGVGGASATALLIPG